jgi:hypothetical protein
MSNKLIVEFDQTHATEVEALMARSGFTEKRDLFSSAFGLMRWASREIAQGKRIGSVDVETGTFSEVDFDFFDSVPKTQAESTG